MADFCKQCSDYMFGPDRDFEDMAGLSKPEDTAQGLYVTVLCESCGAIQVDHTGRCISHTDEQHTHIARTGEIPE